MKPSEPVHVFEDKHEGIKGSFAEISVGECDLDVGILSNEPNAPFEERNAATSVAKQAIDTGIRFSRLDLLCIVLKDGSDHLADSDKSSSKSYRTQVVPESPPHATANSAFSFSITVDFKVPDAC